ncbi:hypothetical protein [Campylobacter sp. CCS1377]|uniref:Highly acidic protein n=1 Tax=Campylobacter sp. CCS1377 TaxID=3158229 RepID=A0AAU7E946_9BACT|nr:hypothetical protein [Campylobacter jejuni]
MKMLLLNNSPVVSRLIGLSAKKMSYELDEKEDCEQIEDYDIVVIDGDMLVDFNELKQKNQKLIVLTNRDQVLDSSIQTLKKPFLPTDFIKLVNEMQDNQKDDIEKLLQNDDKNPYDDIVLNLDELHLEDDVEQENEEPVQDLQVSEDDLDALNLDEKQGQSQVLNETLNGQDLILDEKQDEALEQDEVKEDDLNQSDLEKEENLNQDKVLEEELSLNEEQANEELERNLDEDNKEERNKNLDPILAEDENQNENIPSVLDEDLEFDELDDVNLDEKIENDLPLEQDKILDEEELNKALENLQEEQEVLDGQEQTPEVFEENNEENKPLEDMYKKLSQDAQFIGEEDKEPKHDEEEFEPIVIENISDNENLNYEDKSPQDQIKEELAALSAMDEKDFQEIKIEEKQNELDSLKEEDIQIALGESIENKQTSKEQSEEIVGELTQSIAGAITSSIKDDALKAALKGMKMNINININFEDKD